MQLWYLHNCYNNLPMADGKTYESFLTCLHWFIHNYHTISHKQYNFMDFWFSIVNTHWHTKITFSLIQINVINKRNKQNLSYTILYITYKHALCLHIM